MTDRQFIPPWMGRDELCRHISATVHTVDKWVRDGVLPPPRPRGGKLMWKWSEVDAWLADGKPGGSPDKEADNVRESTKRALAESRNRY